MTRTIATDIHGRALLTVNGRGAESGCYVDGHWGQYGPDHLAEKLESFAIEIPRSDDPRWWRKVADRMEEIADQRGESAEIGQWGPARHRSFTAWENHHETGSDLIDRANAATEGGYWEWWEGEVFLRSYVCAECRRDARASDQDPCDYCADADDPGVYTG